MRFSKLVSSVFAKSRSRHDHSPPRRPRPPSHPLATNYDKNDHSLRDDDWPADEQIDAFDPHRRRMRNRRRNDDHSYANLHSGRRRPHRRDPTPLDDVAEWPTRPILHIRPRHESRHDHVRRHDDIHFYRHPDKDDAPPSRRLEAWRTRHARVKSNLEHSHRAHTNSQQSSMDAPVSDSSSSLRRLIAAAMRTNRSGSRPNRKDDVSSSPSSSVHAASSANEPDAVVGHSGWSDKVEKPTTSHGLVKDASTARRQHFPKARRIRSNIDYIMNRSANAYHQSPPNSSNPSNSTSTTPVKQSRNTPRPEMALRAVSVNAAVSEIPSSPNRTPMSPPRHETKPPPIPDDTNKLRKPPRSSPRRDFISTSSATSPVPVPTPVALSKVALVKEKSSPDDGKPNAALAVKAPNRPVAPIVEENMPPVRVRPASTSQSVPSFQGVPANTPKNKGSMSLAAAELPPVSQEDVSNSFGSLPEGVPPMPPHAVFKPLPPPPGVPQMPPSVFSPAAALPDGVPAMPPLMGAPFPGRSGPSALPTGIQPNDVPRPFIPINNQRMNRLRPPSLDFGPNARPGFAFGILPDSERQRQLEEANIIERPRAGVKMSAVRQKSLVKVYSSSSSQRSPSSAILGKEKLPVEKGSATPENGATPSELAHKNPAIAVTESAPADKISENAPTKGGNAVIPADAIGEDFDEPRAYAKTRSSIWAAATHTDDGSGEEEGLERQNVSRKDDSIIEAGDEDEDLYAIESISQASFEVAETASKIRAKHGIALLEDMSPSGNVQRYVFGKDTAFEDQGITINSNGRIELQEKLTRKMSDGTCDESCVPSSSNLIFIRHLSEFQKKFDNGRAKKMVKTWRPTLGRGAAGKVYLAVHEPTGRKLAVKEINIFDHDRREQMKKELVTLSSLQSRFLVRYFGAFYDGDGGVHVALEYMDRGSLSDVVAQQGKVPEPVLRTIMEHCLRGLKFLHSNHVLHRDVKTANILLSRRHCRAKLSDFGLALNLRNEKLEAMKDGYREEDCDSIARTFVGTVLFMAPERLTSQEYSYASDIWGVGLCALECALGEYPFPPAAGFFDVLECTKTVSSYVEAAPVSDELKDFLTAITKALPNERPTAAELLEHPWIKQGMNDTKSLGDWLDSLPKLKCQEVAITTLPAEQTSSSGAVETAVAG